MLNDCPAELDDLHREVRQPRRSVLLLCRKTRIRMDQPGGQGLHHAGVLHRYRPDGWKYRTRILDEELVIDTTDHLATALQDELENTYTLPN